MSHLSNPKVPEERLRALGLSSESRDAMPDEVRAAITRFAELASRELCGGRVLPGVSGVAVNLLGERTQLNAAKETAVG